MELKMRKISALFQKEIKALPKNKNVLFMCLMPVVFSIIYSYMFGTSGNGMRGIDILFLCLGMNLGLVATYMMAMLIAEEKEKNTLRTLMLSGVSPFEFLIGKLLITFLIITVTNIAMYFIVGIEPVYLGIYILLTTLVVISMLVIGAIIGMIAQNQMATGVVGMPVIIVLFMIPAFAMLNETVEKIAKFLPNYALQIMLNRVISGKSVGSESIFNIVVLLIWIIISVVAFEFAFHKVGLDK